ncbi:MAG: MBL fold metallo-hydrolase [Deltaproteobacteria bacterium]|nr:MBL fold metallo-hydrolase [Deltaproteobacteria bacterium]
MGFEIDFLPVGDGERGGDAICLRYGNINGQRNEYVVIVIDGGTKEVGKAIVSHIQRYYRTNQVDLVISTHPDADHCSGLIEVLEGLIVKILWMHKPWDHGEEIKSLFQSGKITDTSLRENLKKALEDSYSLYNLAIQKEITVHEPFSDETGQHPNLFILGPSKEFYESLLPHFRETPEPKQKIPVLQKAFEVALEAAKDGVSWIAEKWNIETLVDPEPYLTSFENNSSVVLLLKVDAKTFLFTADAGVEALEEAYNKAVALGIDLKQSHFAQIPHHGSRRNVGPSILDRIIGPKLNEEKKIKTAFVSVPKKGDPKHPSRKVTNAFKRRGAGVVVTKGRSILHHSPDSPQRENWSTVEVLPFYNEVEE